MGSSLPHPCGTSGRVTPALSVTLKSLLGALQFIGGPRCTTVYRQFIGGPRCTTVYRGAVLHRFLQSRKKKKKTINIY